jgi:PKD repeat protein
MVLIRGCLLKLSLQKLALALAVMLAGVQPALAQNYPFPGKSSASPVICTACVGTNVSGQPNAGLKTWPYSSPMVNHVGRICDSTDTTDFQGGTGFATARARLVRFSREQHGSAPPRAYIQLGSAIAIYSLDRFFSTELPGGLVKVDSIVGPLRGRGDYPPEKVLKWDALIFPEGGGSEWALTVVDGQDKLFDFDVDDRGYVYVATGNFFGWGMVRDGGQSGASVLPIVPGSQITGASLLGVSPDHILSLKVGSKYYAVTSSNDGGRVVYDTTNPASIQSSVVKTMGFTSYARDDAHGRVAIVTGARTIEIYDMSTFVSGGSALASYSASGNKYYRDVTVDESGNFWTSETSKTPSDNRIVKLERGSSSYTRQTFDVYGEAFSPQEGPGEGLATINYGDKYLTVTGRTGAGGGNDSELKVFKIEGGAPVPFDLGGFISKYYYKPPRDYAQPKSVSRPMGGYPIKWNNKQYLMYNTQGLGDVFEIQAGDSINVTQKSGLFGTANPYANPSSTEAYYGDILKFSAASSSSTQYAITWNFDNPDSLSENTKTGNTGQDITHQFSGLDTTGEIGAVRHVTATANSDSEVNGTASVTLKLPTARIGVAGTSSVVIADGSTLDIVAGDQLTDASDGSVEGHYSQWTIDGVPSKQTPDTPISAGLVGAHTAKLEARYGQYNGAFSTTGSPYTDTVSSLDVNVLPFVVSFVNPTVSGSTVTFKGSARVTQLSAILSATSWDVEWSLKDGSTDVVPVQSGSASIGVIPNFVVPDRSSIPSGSVLQLKVSVSSGLGIGVPSQFGTYTLSQTLLTPDPQITKTGCTNTGNPCTLSVSSAHSHPTSDWSVLWTLKLGASTVTTQTLAASAQFKPSLSAPGNYTVTAKASTNLFEGTASVGPFAVEGELCGPVPTAGQIQIYASCGDANDSPCAVGEVVTMRAESFDNSYDFQHCEVYNWTYGDGSAVFSTSAVNATHAYSSTGNKQIKLTITKGSQTSQQFSLTIAVGGGGGGDPLPTCTSAPSNIQISYTGNKGCQPGVPCKNTESVTFTAFRGSGSLIGCDTTSWTYSDGGGSASLHPSHTFSSVGSATVNVTVTNDLGQANGVIQVPIVADTGACGAPPTSNDVEIDYDGQTSGCQNGDSKVCSASEQIKFRVLPSLGYTIAGCNQYDWNFGDGTSHSADPAPLHAYAGGVAAYHASVRIYNNSNTTGNTITVDVPFQSAPVLETPVLTYSSFPSTGTKGNQVTFTVNSNIPATGWSWNFGDSPLDNSQATQVGVSNTITHTFATPGTYKVLVKARNSQETNTSRTSQVDRDIVIDEVPEYRYLLPVVAHAAGIGSVWRTDVQIYTSDSAVSPANPLSLTASYKGVNYPLIMRTSTLILQDILNDLRPGVTEQGSMIITVKTQKAPQIWSRTYNQTADGTFGQFIPAILLNEAGGGSAIGEGRYYLAGLKSDARYRTNVGLVNPNASAMTAIIRLYDDRGVQIGTATPHILQPFQLDQFPVTGPADRSFSVEIEVPAGTWVIGYASFIDGGSSDPVYLQAIRQSEVGSADYRDSVVPGVGHTGAWRSDVTVYNPNGHTVTVDLGYYNATGVKLAEAKNIPINAGQFVQYGDLLRQGILGSVADGVGTLRISVPGTVSADYFPLSFARTYYDDGSGKTYGQGIPGFAAARANVKAGKSALIPAVRNDDKYYTNLGLTNVSSTAAVAIVRVLDPNSGSEIRRIDYPLQPNESLVATQLDILGTKASLKIEASGGNIWAFASIIDRGTKDPEYVAATPLP